MEKLLRFKVGERAWAVPVRRVLGVVPLSEGNPLPGSPAWLAGLWAWRGEAVPGVRLDAIFGGSAQPKWMLVLDAEAPVGLLVDEVLGTEDGEWSPAEDPLLLGVSGRGEGVLDPEGVLKLCGSWFSGQGA